MDRRTTAFTHYLPTYPRLGAGLERRVFASWLVCRMSSRVARVVRLRVHNIYDRCST